MAAPFVLAAPVACIALAAQWPAPGQPDARPATRGERRQVLSALSRGLDRDAPARGRAAERLRDFLDAPDMEARAAAARALARAGDPAALERALAWLDGGSPELRLGAIQALRGLPGPRLPPEVATRLGELSSHPHAAVRLGALHVLEERRASLPGDLIRRALRDELAESRVLGLRAAARTGEVRWSALAVEALADPDEAVRAAAARALGRLGDARALPALARRLGAAELPGAREPEAVRAALADALGDLGTPLATATLAPLVRDRRADEGVRAALQALGRLAARGDDAAARAALEALLERLDGFAPNDPLAGEVDLALAGAGEPAARALAERLRARAGSGTGDPRDPGDARLVAILEQIASATAVHALAGLLQSSSPALPLALDALARLCAREAADDLRLLQAHDPSPALRRQAARVLTTLERCAGPR